MRSWVVKVGGAVAGIGLGIGVGNPGVPALALLAVVLLLAGSVPLVVTLRKPD